MTALGEPLVDRTGRSQGKRKSNRRTKIGGQFAPRLIEMLESPAWGATSLSFRRVLDRIEIELAHHGGADNGRLPVTHADFSAYGLDGHSIAPAIREGVALGFLEITRRGSGGTFGHLRSPTYFRITYQPTQYEPPTHEWRRIRSKDDAEQIAREAREKKPPPRGRQRRAAPSALLAKLAI